MGDFTHYQTLATFDNFYRKMNTHHLLEDELVDFVDFVYRIDDDLKQNYLKREELKFLLEISANLEQRIASITYKTEHLNPATPYNTSKIIQETIGYMTLIRGHLLNANIGVRNNSPFTLTCELMDYVDKHTALSGKDFLKTHGQEEINCMIITMKFFQFIEHYHPECIIKSLELSSALSDYMCKLCLGF